MDRYEIANIRRIDQSVDYYRRRRNVALTKKQALEDEMRKMFDARMKKLDEEIAYCDSEMKFWGAPIVARYGKTVDEMMKELNAESQPQEDDDEQVVDTLFPAEDTVAGPDDEPEVETSTPPAPSPEDKDDIIPGASQPAEPAIGDDSDSFEVNGQADDDDAADPDGTAGSSDDWDDNDPSDDDWSDDKWDDVEEWK